MSGKTIEFSITSGDGELNGGTTSASSVTDDNDGIATVELSNTTEGDIIITARYCNKSVTTTVTCDALNIEVNANKNYVSPGETSTITAKLTDGSGNPVTGKTIDFSAVYSENLWILTNDTVVTDENGIATAVLSDAKLGTATVTAAYGTLTDMVTVTCTEFVLDVSASDGVIAPGDTSTITAKLTDTSGNPIEGETIDFSAVYVPEENLWTLTINNDGVTDGSGIATAELSDAKLGTATVTGTYGSTSDHAVVTCNRLNIVVNAAEDTVVPGKPCTITATLTDNEIPVEGATITFLYTTCGTWDSTTENPTTAITLGDGKAQVDLIFSEGDEDKTATITVTYTISTDPLLEISDTTTVTCKIKKDFKVIHGNSVIQSRNRTLTLRNGHEYALEPGVTFEDCFVRIVNTRITGIGRTSRGGTQNLDDYTVRISNPENILSSFNFRRVGRANNCRVTWEIIQYIGAEGGANEIKVRTAGELSTTAINVNGPSLSNISNINKAVIYITGQSGSNTGRGEWNECLFTAEFMDNDPNWTPRFSRGRARDTGRVSYAVVEFTGSNWRNIQRVPFISCGSTVTITTPLLDTTKTFLHCQYTYVKNGNSGLDDSGETVEVLSTTQLRSRRRTSRDANLKHHVVWVMENTQSTGKYMIVQHVSGTRWDNSGSEEHVWSEAINEVRALDEASIQGETLASYGTDTRYPEVRKDWLLQTQQILIEFKVIWVKIVIMHIVSFSSPLKNEEK